MSRRTWKKDTLCITYGNPSITPHRELEKYKIKCPKCGEHQLYLESLLPKNEESQNEEFRCIKCGHEFDDDDDYCIN